MEVREKLRLLQLQLAKFRLGEDYTQPLEKTLSRPRRPIWRSCIRLLIAPIRTAYGRTSDYCPAHFPALPAISCAFRRRTLPDRRFFHVLCAQQQHLCRLPAKAQAESDRDTLVMAVPDARAPYIEEEGAFCGVSHGKMPGFLWARKPPRNSCASYGPQSRFIHIATHGYFRQDNPMFSSIRLGNSLLSLV